MSIRHAHVREINYTPPSVVFVIEAPRTDEAGPRQRPAPSHGGAFRVLRYEVPMPDTMASTESRNDVVTETRPDRTRIGSHGDGRAATSGTLAPLESTKQAILERLLESDRHVLSMAHDLRIRESAIRRHFDQLERKGLVRGYFKQEGLGRPKKYYGMTEEGRQRFPGPFAEALARALQVLVKDGRAADAVQAVPELVRERVEHHRVRFAEAHTPLAKARALELVLNEVGVVVHPRITDNQIRMDSTSTIVLRHATGLDHLPKTLRETVVKAATEAAQVGPVDVVAGDELLPASQH